MKETTPQLLREYRAKCIKEINAYGEMHRFLPILADEKGFLKKEVKCDHFQERGQTSIYKVAAYVGRLLDILTLYLNTRFSRQPLRFLGNIGVVFIIIGGLIGLYVFAQKIFMKYPIGDQSILLLAILSMALAVQYASSGLLGEINTFP